MIEFRCTEPCKRCAQPRRACGPVRERFREAAERANEDVRTLGEPEIDGELVFICHAFWPRKERRKG